jgi:hypothetical protein
MVELDSVFEHNVWTTLLKIRISDLCLRRKLIFQETEFDQYFEIQNLALCLFCSVSQFSSLAI